MPITPYHIVGQSYTERSLDWDAQTCVNFYIAEDPSGRYPTILAPTPGTKFKTQIFGSNAPIRAIHSNGNHLFAVTGNHLVKCDKVFGVETVGQLHSSIGHTSMMHNNNQIVLVDGSYGYVYHNQGGFEIIQAPGFPASPQMIDYLDGFFISFKGGSNVFRISKLNDATQWDEINYAIAQSAPGALVGLATLHGRLFLFGETATEVWYNAGAPNFPFRRDNNLLLEYGCASKASIAKGHQRLFWLSRDKDGVGSVKMTDGLLPKTISTSALEYAIQNYRRVDDAFGFVYKEDGHLFYQLTFSSENMTWLYDATMQAWTQLQQLNGSCHIANCHAFYNNEHIVGSYQDSKLYALSSQFITNNGEHIRRERRGPHFADTGNRNVKISAFDVLMETGVSTKENIPEQMPQISLSVSRDRGHTFCQPKMRSMGTTREYGKRIIWRKFGISRDWVFKLETLSPARTYILGANIHHEVMRS